MVEPRNTTNERTNNVTVKKPELRVGNTWNDHNLNIDFDNLLSSPSRVNAPKLNQLISTNQSMQSTNFGQFINSFQQPVSQHQVHPEVPKNDLLDF